MGAGSSMGYFVPLAPNLTRHFHGMLTKAPSGQSSQMAKPLGNHKSKARHSLVTLFVGYYRGYQMIPIPSSALPK